jgi:hypothetical protein
VIREFDKARPVPSFEKDVFPSKSDGLNFIEARFKVAFRGGLYRYDAA